MGRRKERKKNKYRCSEMGQKTGPNKRLSDPGTMTHFKNESSLGRSDAYQ